MSIVIVIKEQFLKSRLIFYLLKISLGEKLKLPVCPDLPLFDTMAKKSKSYAIKINFNVVCRQFK